MNVKGFGINTRKTDGNFSKLEEQLSYLEDAGFDYLEVSADVVDTIAGGKIVPQRMEKLIKLLDRYKFKRTAHIQNQVDLRDREDRDFHLVSLRSGIEFAGNLGAELLVCHFEKESEDPAEETLFYEAILEGVEYAQKWDLKIGVENIEIDKLSKVVDIVKKVNDPGVILVLDVGHAFLSENYFGEDFLESIRNAAPFTGHIHLSDNFGRYEKMRLENFDLYRVSNYTNRLNMGRGDLNLPPGWGALPLKDILEILRDYKGIAILEYYHDKYLDFNRGILKETKELFSRY